MGNRESGTAIARKRTVRSVSAATFPRHEIVLGTAHQDINPRADHADQDNAHQHDVSQLELGGDHDHHAGAFGCGDEFGGDDLAPTDPHRDARARENLGQRVGNDDVSHDLELAGAQRVRSMDLGDVHA